jgi:hypothetical protein
MAADPKIRASDEDRDRTASLLREHHAVGRLTPEEFSERLDKVYEAKTVGDLDELMSDLPGIDLYRLPHASMPPYRGPAPGGASSLAAMAQGGLARGHGRFSPAWQAAWGSWFSVSLVCFVIWALGGRGYLWPLWVAGPWAALMLGRWITGGHPQGGGGPRRNIQGGPHGHNPHRQRPDDPDQIGGRAPDQ